MISTSPVYISALEARDIKHYPTEISKIPVRGPVAAPDADRSLNFSDIVADVAADSPTIPTDVPKVKTDRPLKLWEKEQFGFRDVVDIINPLQHLPIVATVYRQMTGDKIGLAPRVIGGAIWGRIGGFVSGLINAVVDWFTGKDIGDHIYSALFGTPGDSESKTTVAQSAKPSSQIPEIPTATREQIQPTPKEAKSSVMPGSNIGALPLEEEDSQIGAWKDEAPVAALKIAALNSYSQGAATDASVEAFGIRFFA